MGDENTGGSDGPRPKDTGVSSEVITTPEGFKIHGKNETSFLRSLTSINGVTIAELEARMRPKASSDAGFLGTEESLTGIIAEDNDAVLGMGLTHQQLGDFLRQFTYASSMLGINYNGIEFRHTLKQWKGNQASPFGDGTSTAVDNTILNLKNGTMINFSGLLPDMIHRYGFYEGKGTPYRLDPRKIAEVAGFILPSQDDPIAKLVQNPDAQVDIRTKEQFERISNLASAGIDVLSGQNYRIAPEDLTSLIQFFKQFEKSEYDKTEEAERKIALIEHLTTRIDINNILPQNYRPVWYDTIVLTDIVPSDFSHLKQAVLDGIEQLFLPSGRGGNPIVKGEKEFLEKILMGCIPEKTEGEENPHKDYYEGLLKKLSKDPKTTELLIKAAISFNDRPELIAILDEVLPALKTDFLALCKQQGIQVSDDMDLEQLIGEQKKMDEYKYLLKDVARMTQNRGGVEDAQTEDIESLVAIMNIVKGDPNHQYTPDEIEVLRQFKIDPELIPFAFRYLSALTSNMTVKRDFGIDWVIESLYDGTAKTYSNTI